MSAPRLTESDLRLEIERIFGKDRRSKVAALFGTGDEATLVVGGEPWKIQPTRCELDLRINLPEISHDTGEHGVGTVYLVDWTEDPLPLDIRCRLAGGAVFRVSRGTRLATLFGARQAEDGLMSTGLAQVLLSEEIEGLKKVAGLMLTLEAAMRRFLDAWAGFPLGRPLTAASVLAWTARNESGPALVQRAASSPMWERLRGEIRDFVVTEAGALGGLAWDAWEKDEGVTFVAFAVLADAQHRSGDAEARGLLQATLHARLSCVADALLEHGPSIAAVLDEALNTELSAPDIERVLRTAEQLVEAGSFATTRAASPWLPSGHAAREDALGTALEAVAATPTPEAFAGVTRALTDVEAHELDRSMRSKDQRDVRRMGARLGAWLVAHAQREEPPLGVPAWQTAVDLARAFAEEGGFVDWCRQRLRSPSSFSLALRAGLHAVLDEADARRAHDNELFAHGFLAWLGAGRPSQKITPIGTALQRYIGELRDGHPELRLLVVLMDGMSWANATQILSRLQEERWGAVAWRPRGHEAERFLPPVLAEVPTITCVSRATFFAGRSDARFGNQPSQKDAERWRSNRLLQRLTGHDEVPELVLRRGLMKDRELQPEVNALISDEAPVVGVVVNAIDEELKGSSQVYKDYSLPNRIKPLEALLQAAAGAERVVLLASDHGHVPGDAMTPHGQSVLDPREGGKRWRALGSDGTLHPFEVRLPDTAWAPAGSRGLAAVWDERVAHGVPAYGEHGGISLPEVVAPAILIAPEWLAEVRQEETTALDVRSLATPPWWHLETQAPIERRPPERRPRPAAGAQRQLSILDVAPAGPVVPTQTARATTEPEIIQALRKSPVLRRQVAGKPQIEIDRVMRYLAVLVEAGDAMADREFARRVGIRPHRVGGTVALMGILNCDGFAMVEHDLAGRRVVLNLSRLVQQYGLSE